ncbi:MAG: MBL fold metallo-hydrolase [Actinomycetota bacterium]|nr:MBL fold metallo-hydrolase [Actinomycetota bacterium]
MSLTRLDELTSVVLAPNPSPLTLDGTNTYLLGVPGCGEVIVVDPGPDLLEHRQAVDSATAGLDATIAAVVLTHHHADHAEAAGWAADWGVQVWTFTPSFVQLPAAPFHDGEQLSRAGVTLEALHTPGHASDHLCLRVCQTDAVLSGDHVLGRGTTVVAWPDGDMAAYLASLRRLAARAATALYPGHGPVVADPAAAIAQYLTHREEREAEVLAALATGDATPAQVVVRVYADVDPVLHPAAERTVRAQLAKLLDEGRITRVVDPDGGDVETYRPQAAKR